MKVKGWFVAAAAVVILGMVLLGGFPYFKALAMGDTPAGLVVQGVFQKNIAMHMVCGITDLADFLGISREELTGALQSGKTVVQVAAEKGISEQQLVDFMAEKYSERIDQKVADGKITAEQAKKLKQSMTERIKTDLNRANTGPNFGKDKMDPKDGPGTGMKMGRGMGDMEDLAGFLGISMEDLLAARQSGKTLVQIAGEKGITEEQLVDHMMAEFNSKIDQKAAAGKITAEQADQLKQSMTERIKACLNSTDTCPKGP
ncbi:hypothetical protein ACOBQJ_11060 [Pelotomaculum propionicicum]|uniref:hypothetical protein n=1 Tax=Pelotomaculum propionicicum TaxID=258475 RepID=UPI003B765875